VAFYVNVIYNKPLLIIYRSYLWSLILSVLCFSKLDAQDEFNHRLFTTDNGLPHNQIECITQDKTGFLWIATWDGLSRFDGNEFKNYYHRSNDSTSFPFFSLDKVVTDKYNNIWVFSEGRSIVYYERMNDRFRHLDPDSIGNMQLSDVALGPDSILWFTSEMSLGSYDSGNKRFNLYRIKNETNFRFSRAKSGLQLVFDNRGGIWFYYTANSEFCILKGTYTDDSTVEIRPFGSIRFGSNKSAALHNTTGNIDIYVSDSSKIWFFTRYGLFRFDSLKNKIVKNNFDVHAGDFKGKPYFIWTDDDSGIHIIDSEKRSLINIRLDKEDYTETTFIDNTGIIWSGNVNQQLSKLGLNQYLKTPSYFRNYLVGKYSGKAATVVYPVLKLGKDILVRSKSNTNLVKIKPDGSENLIGLHNRDRTPNTSKVMCLAEDHEGIWIGTEGNLNYYNLITKNDSVCAFKIRNKISYSLAVHNIIRSGNGLVINGAKGAFFYDPRTGDLMTGFSYFPEGTGFTIIRDSSNGYWVGTYSSTVLHLDKDLMKTAQFKVGTENDLIQHICNGDSNDIWLAIMGEGLGHLFPESGKYEIFTTADGLANNVTYSILKDKKGNLWISTNKGLSRFDPKTHHFMNFGKSEGLKISEFSADSFYESDDGEMFFGGVGGFVGFYPDSIDLFADTSRCYHLILTDLKVSGFSRYFKKPIYELDSLRMNKGDNNFQITFALPNFKNSEKIRYRYRLVGEKGGWTETDFRARSVSFAGLTHNNYRLDIQATNAPGQWEYSKSIIISIPPTFTETLIFKILILFGIILVIFTIVYVYIRQIRIKAMHEQDLLKLESLRGQMNPHFIFNSLNSINYFIMNEDKIAANDYISDFSRLIRSFLDNLTNDYIPLNKEIESIRDYLKLEHLRFGDKFDYFISVELSGNNNDLYVFPGLIQPFIENAIWHGVRGLENRKGRINITFQTESTGILRCRVGDDGIGRRLAEHYKVKNDNRRSHGISIVKDRLKIINNLTRCNYHLTIDDLYPELEETGTLVTIFLPIIRL
jgi:ligand-binding sensor domain-containing protein